MPFVHVYAYDGRTVDQKRALVRGVTDAICRAYDVEPETVQVYIFDHPRDSAAHAGVLAIDEPPRLAQSPSPTSEEGPES